MHTKSTTPVLLLPEWSVTTPDYVRYSNRGKDTPRSRWEAQGVANHNKAAKKAAKKYFPVSGNRAALDSERVELAVAK